MNRPIHIPRSGYAALRKGSISLEGNIYLVTFATSRRIRLFDDPEFARVASHAICDARLWQSAKLLTWVLMPDHWHGLVELGATGTLPATVQKLKSNTARRIRLENPKVGVVWEKGFHDRAVRADESVLHLARYIVLNPIRAKVVRRVSDYPYWNAVWL